MPIVAYLHVDYGGGPTPTLNFITKLDGRDWCGNHGTGVYIEVRNVGAASHICRQFVVTDQYGRYNGLPLSGVSPGTYDIYAKGQSHLARGKGSVNISAGVNEIDFSDWHTVYLLGGDFDGDNVILDFGQVKTFDHRRSG